MMNVLGWSSTWVESLHSQLPPHVGSITNTITNTITISIIKSKISMTISIATRILLLMNVESHQLGECGAVSQSGI